MADTLEELREKVTLSQRILGMFGIYQETVGHTSARIPDSDEMWLRCRGGDEKGMQYTTVDQIRRMDFDGNNADLADGVYSKVNELPIHGEIYKRRPEVNSVLHGHPTYGTLCAMSGIALRPIFGAYDPQAMQMALQGVPLYERSVLVNTPELAATMIAVMGTKDILLMNHHGNVATGRTVEEATVRAIKMERLAKLHWEFAKAGVVPENISQADIEHFTSRPRPPSANLAVSAVAPPNYAWNFYVKLLESSGGAKVDILL